MFDFWLLITFCGATFLLVLWRDSDGDPLDMLRRIGLIALFLVVVFGGAALLTCVTAGRH